ncbi:nucleotidyltransferase family protein [Mucilaginibacter angelicae]|uniref:glucose-1-phosphate thymidylyltransferase n=1 Tax=Mucilaginibacter angelicae TaxID=869718 RepID=A0ABV6L1I8_9SPHI
MEKIYGLLPAAGLATRMRPFRYPKELLPIHYQFVDETEYVRPKLLIEHSLEALNLGGVNDLYIVVPEWKPEIMRYLEDGAQFGHSISYLYNSKALGLADALLSGYPWLCDKITCFAMPDTIFSPPTAFRDIITELQTKNADLVLGIFPTDEAQHFGPVEFDATGKVLQVWEKPAEPKVNNAWGIAVWNSRFWDFFKSEAAALEPGVSITHTFNRAARQGLKVQSVYFENGWYKDIGRINQITFNN